MSAETTAETTTKAGAKQPGWVRRLLGYMLRHRRNVMLAIGEHCIHT